MFSALKVQSVATIRMLRATQNCQGISDALSASVYACSLHTNFNSCFDKELVSVWMRGW